MSTEIHVAYDALDRFLRNNMDDATYAEYSGHLETVLASRQPVGEPVAVVGRDYLLQWYGTGPIAPLVERNGIEIGSLLYATPPAQETATAVDLGQLQRFDPQLFENPWPYSGMEDAVEGSWVRFDDVKALIDSHSNSGSIKE